MTRKKLLAAALIAAALTGGGAARAADSVQLFEQLVKPTIKEATLTYGKATATGPTSLVLSDVVLTPLPKPDKPAEDPVSIASVIIDDIDFDGIAKGDAPWRLSARFAGISVGANSAVPPEVALMLGPGPYKANVEIDYKVVDGKELQIALLSLEFPGLAKLWLTLDLDGIEAKGAKLNDASFDDVTLRAGSLTYEDQSLLGKVVSASAKEQNKSPDFVVGEWAGVLGLLAAKQGDDGTPLVNGLLALLQDYKAPKGPLKISFTPPHDASGGRPIKEAMTAGVVKTLGASATYAGKTFEAAPAHAASAAAAPVPAVVGAGSVSPPDSCKPGMRFYALWHDVWYAATAIDATKEKGLCLVRYDGYGADDDEALAADHLRPWGPDGPGAPAGRCQKGEQVVVEFKGAWYPAEVRQSGGAGTPCPIHYKSSSIEKENDDVPLARVRRL
ncbi:MAG: hypothetical protein ACHQF3_01830 [Alphaproteobacteria bacterium]